MSARKVLKGISYIEVIVVVGILGILLSAIFTLVSTSYETISYTKARTSALHVAQEKMEILHNLPYADLGTQGGIPSGDIPQVESIIQNNQEYEVKTTIVYVDDDFDGISPADLLPTDYKRVRVEVNWGGIANSKRDPIVLVNDISPNGIETNEGGGTLIVTVFSSLANPISQAEVTIYAPTSPTINLTLDTDDSGRVILPGAPTCTNCYEISVTKEGYSSDRTYSNTEIANPAKPHSTILEGELTEISFSIDRLSELTIYSKGSRSSGFPAIGNVSFNLVGEKIIGTDTLDTPIAKYNQSLTTNSLGQITISNLEWDTYQVSLNGTIYNISGTNPLVPISILPNTTSELSFSLNPYSANSYLVSFVDSANAPVAGAQTTLTRAGYEQSIPSGSQGDPDFGHAFFPNLNVANYNLEATVSGYLGHNATVQILGKTTERIVLGNE